MLAPILAALAAFGLTAGGLVVKSNAMATLWELGEDRTNPHDATRDLNAFCQYELIAHVLCALAFAAAGDLRGLLLSLPLACWHAAQHSRQRFAVDVTEILKRPELDRRKLENKVEVAAYALLLLYSAMSLVELLISWFLQDTMVEKLLQTVLGALTGHHQKHRDGGGEEPPPAL